MGTLTFKWVGVAATTVARTAPKKTMLFAGVESKLVPEMVTAVPMAPLAGVKVVICGMTASTLQTFPKTITPANIRIGNMPLIEQTDIVFMVAFYFMLANLSIYWKSMAESSSFFVTILHCFFALFANVIAKDGL